MLQDIEELTGAENNRNSVNYISVKKYNKKIFNDVFPKKAESDHFLPGGYSIFVKTWGCGHNSSDSEYMAGLLHSQGYKIVDDEDQADLWVLNSCTVKNPSEQTFVNRINQAEEKGKKLVLAGCVPQAQPKGYQNYSIIGVQQIDRVVEVVEETIKGHSVQLLGQKKENGRKTGGAELDLPKIRRNQFVEIIPISTGCLNQCTYCKTKQARGNLGSYSIDSIVSRAISVFKEGVKTIHLTSEDTGAYGRDIGVTIIDLLEELVKVIPDGCMLRLGMTNPPYIMEHKEAIAKILSHPRVYSFLHIPIQAASDRVLYDMKRDYTVFEFRLLVDYLIEHCPGITIATDIICGFPTETDEDFEETMDLIQDYKFSVIHISQFYPRPGTPAAKLARLPTEKVKERSRKLTTLFESYTCYDELIGEQLNVLVTERSNDSFVGHSKSYIQVLIKDEGTDLMGQFVQVKVIQTDKFHVKGKVVENVTHGNRKKIKENKKMLTKKTVSLPFMVLLWIFSVVIMYQSLRSIFPFSLLALLRVSMGISCLPLWYLLRKNKK